MDKYQTIEQLENLQEHCEDMRDKEDMECTWLKDTIALEIAIKAIEKDLKAPQQNKSLRKTIITQVYQD